MRTLTALLMLSSLLVACGGKEEESCLPADRRPAWSDRDHDGAGDPGTEVQVCAITRDLSPIADDCDDGDAAVSPFAVEVCNGIDDDCDGRVDEFFVTLPFWPDVDGDGTGDVAVTPVWACLMPDGMTDAVGDCDDTLAAVGPHAEERCNTIDDDCDGLLDDLDDSVAPGDLSTWFVDDDGDGFGDPDLSTDRCEAPNGAVDNGDDCADGIAAVHPGALEVCDGVDDDCNGLADDDDPAVDQTTYRTFYADVDLDGFGDAASTTMACRPPAGFVVRDDDCNDADPLVTEPLPWLTDADGDGAGILPPAAFACDRPDPGLVSPDAGVDCDDANPLVLPGTTEVCNDLDDDCDGRTDDADGSLDVATTLTWFRDFDLDGHGQPDLTVARCRAPQGWSLSDLDCDDGDPAVSPDGAEVCNDIDDDCDTAIDDADPSVDGLTFSLWYLDGDLDGWGTASDVVASCDPPVGYTATATDCDDGDPALGAAEQWLLDSDFDGFGSTQLGPPVAVSCDAPGPGTARVSVGLDCDDADAASFPGAPEQCTDGVDQDCDGVDRCVLFSEDFETGTLDPARWTLTGDGMLSPDPAIGMWSANLGGGGATLDSLVFDTSACSVLELSYQVKRGPLAPAVGSFLQARYSDALGSAGFDAVPGNAEDDPTFGARSVVLTNPRAYSPDFALHFEVVGTGLGLDDFYVDDLVLWCE